MQRTTDPQLQSISALPAIASAIDQQYADSVKRVVTLREAAAASHRLDAVLTKSSGRARHQTIELLNYRKDCTSFWNELHLSPIHDDDGKLIYCVASQLDVGERHRMHELEAAERAMLRDRAPGEKRTGSGPRHRSPEEGRYGRRVCQSGPGRVDALSKAHTVLAEARWQDVPLDRMIRAEVEPFGPRPVSLDGPSVAISPTQVQPLAFVLHEVIANAVCHGALSTPAGTLSIRWTPAHAWTQIEIHEAGGPSPANDRSPGFGMKIMDAILQRQLRGSVSYDWQPDGLRSVLELPREAAYQ